MIWFALSSLTPAILLALASLWGGVWSVLAVCSITLVAFWLDRISHTLPTGPHSGRGLSLTLAGVHFALLGLAIWALAAQTGLALTDKALIFIGYGLYFGQISNSNAHELIHASGRWPRRIGVAIYASLLNGHHVSAHLRVHHIHAATDADPNSARPGEGFYTYALRVIRGEFIAGLRADTDQRARSGRASRLSHPYVAYLGGAALSLGCAALIAGAPGMGVLAGLAVYAQMQLMLSDYVQHYGLRRRQRADGRMEPVGPHHSWNAPAWYSSAMMLNAPRHSDHHMRPNRPFPALEVAPETMPVLPRSLPVMAVLALIPPLWRRVMDPRVARWRASA